MGLVIIHEKKERASWWNEIIQTIQTELHYENSSAPPESKLAAPEESDIVSNELLRPIFRIGSIDGSQDGDEGGLRDVDQVFELKRRTSSLSSQGADGGHLYSRQDSLQEDYEDMSLSSSGFSPGSTSASLKSFEGRNRIDDFSECCYQCISLCSYCNNVFLMVFSKCHKNSMIAFDR